MVLDTFGALHWLENHDPTSAFNSFHIISPAFVSLKHPYCSSNNQGELVLPLVT